MKNNNVCTVYDNYDLFTDEAMQEAKDFLLETGCEPIGEDINDKIQQFIKEFRKEELVKKYLYDITWLSGSSTTVYPITVWKSEIVCQWKSDKRIFDKFINRIVEKYSDLLKSGCFYKTDGSCPSIITFKLKESL